MKDLLIEKKKTFQRSVNIKSDLNNIELLETFIPSMTGNKTLSEFCKNIASGQGAYTWTGAYGSGKSTLAVILLSLLSQKNSKTYQLSKHLVSDQVRLDIETTFDQYKKRLVLPLVGPQGELETILKEKIAQLAPEEEMAQTSVDMISAISEKRQVVLVIDELGKYLEDAAKNARDIFILQQLAELANRSEGKFIFLGILHQSFSQYTLKFDKEIKDEWQKIQGRFIDIPINITIAEQLSLISLCMDNQINSWANSDPKKHIQNFIKQIKAKEKWLDEELLLSMQPLNIISAFLVAFIAKKSFSQNQRTLFSFLNSSEPGGYERYLESDSEFQNYAPYNLWDYLVINFDAQLINSSDAHAWLVARECLSRLESIEHTSLEIQCLKIIAIIQIFGDKTLVKNDFETIACSLVVERKETINEALENLVKKKLIFFKEINNVYNLAEATDFDLEKELAPYLIATFPNKTELNSLLKLRPSVGKRHYIKTGNLRWLDIELIPFDEFSDDENDLNDPRLFIVLGQGNEKRAAVLKKINAKIKSAPYPVVVSYPKHSEILSKNILRLFSLKELRKENQILQLDKVARRYVDEEMNYLESVIEDGIEQSLSEADWHFSRDSKTLAPQVIDASTLNAAISSLFDHYYPNAPIIKNELANKNFPSPNANSAIRILMNRCIENQDEANLGLPIDKMPPEKTIYNAVIANFGLHHERAVNEFSLEAPQKDGKGDALSVMWTEALKILKKKKSVTAVEIMSIWEMPPFGVKRGLMPLLLLLFYLTNRKNVALYFENIFQTEINEMTSEFLIRVAKDFSFKYVDYDASVNTYSWMAKTIRDELELTHPVEPTSLGVGRALVTYQKNTCPKFTQSTRSLSETTMLLRNELNRSHDPLILVDEKLASNFKEPKTLKKALREIKNCYPKRIESFKKIFIEELKLSDAANPGEEIRERAKLVSGKTSNLLLEPFINSLCEIDNHLKNFETVMRPVLRKDPRTMIDLDIGKGEIELKHLIYEFEKAEQFVKVDGRKKKSSAISFIYGGTNKKATLINDFSLSKKQSNQAKKLSEEFINWKKDGMEKEVILGAIAEYLESLNDEHN